MYEIIQYRLDLGSYERLNTGIIVAMISYSFIFKSLKKISQWSTVVMARYRFNSATTHCIDIMCFTK